MSRNLHKVPMPKLCNGAIKLIKIILTKFVHVLKVAFSGANRLIFFSNWAKNWAILAIWVRTERFQLTDQSRRSGTLQYARWNLMP